MDVDVPRLEEAIAAAVGSILHEHGAMLGDWCAIFSILGEDDIGYFTAYSDNTPLHSQIGLVEMLAGDVTDDDE